jgi:rhodanese-related sulfurtransferase
MAVKRVSPEEARDLMEKDGYTYLDVRSVPEFESGHPRGAFNIPLNHMGPGGMSPNPDFLSVVQKTFPPDAKLVLGCKGGGRSLRAAEMLQAAGFKSIIDQRAGFEGSATEAGWRPRGLPTESQAEPGRAYETLQSKA